MDRPMASAAYAAENGPCQASMEGEALAPAKARSSSVVECQGGSWGWVGRCMGEHPHGVRGWRNGTGGFWRENQERITFEM